MKIGLELGIWLGMAGVALGLVQIALWRTRRVLRRSRQITLVRDIALLSPEAHVPSAMKQPANSVLAS